MFMIHNYSIYQKIWAELLQQEVHGVQDIQLHCGCSDLLFRGLVLAGEGWRSRVFKVSCPTLRQAPKHLRNINTSYLLQLHTSYYK